MENKDRLNPRGTKLTGIAQGAGGGIGIPSRSTFSNRQLDKFYNKRAKQKRRDEILSQPHVQEVRKRVQEEVLSDPYRYSRIPKPR